MTKRYTIIRHHAPHTGRANETIKEGLTLAAAQAHCQSDDTHGPDWFDGYTEEGRAPRAPTLLEKLCKLQTL